VPVLVGDADVVDVIIVVVMVGLEAPCPVGGIGFPNIGQATPCPIDKEVLEHSKVRVPLDP